MKCQRCVKGKEAKYRVDSEVLDLKVCSSCAAEACTLRLAVELLHPVKQEETTPMVVPNTGRHEL